MNLNLVDLTFDNLKPSQNNFDVVSSLVSYVWVMLKLFEFFLAVSS